MTWARVVNNEIVEIFDEDPAKYFHPDLLHEWVDIPDEGVHAGWKFKNGKWISGGQWYEEFYKENPIPPEGPPTVLIEVDHKETRTHDQLIFRHRIGGVGDLVEWRIDGKTYTTDEVSLEVEKGTEIRTIPVKCTVAGPGGNAIKELTGDEAVTVAPVFVPLFQKT